MWLTIDKQMKMQYVYIIIINILYLDVENHTHGPHFNCSAGRTQNVSGVDLIKLDSSLELCTESK